MDANRRLKLVSFLSIVVLVVFAVTLFTAMPSVAKKHGPKCVYQTIPISMQMEAGTPFEQPWDTSDGSRLAHSGIGWVAPFGRATYVCVRDYAPSADYKPAYMDDESWSTMFRTGGFCIMMLEDGDIYVWDGVMGNVEPGVDDDGKVDYLINVIVGGTGRYRDAKGMFFGRTPGRLDGGPDTGLPLSLLKIMEGYINIKVKKSEASNKMPFVGRRNPQKWPDAIDYLVEGNLIPINIDMELGRLFWHSWTSGTTTSSGSGWVSPFGRAEYYQGNGFAEDTEELRPDFMDYPSWSTPYPTEDLGIYQLEGGDIYTYSGVVGRLAKASHRCFDGKGDFILEVVVGGTGDYAGATGMVFGYALSRGEEALPDDPTATIPLPDSKIKLMEGYIRVKGE